MRKPISPLWLQGLLCGALLAFAAPIAVLAAVLLAPAVMTAMLDSSPGRALVRPVLFAGLAFSIDPLFQTWQAEGGFAAALDCLARPRVLLMAWLAGACGWAMAELLPLAVRAAFRARAAHRKAILVSELKQIEADWDLAVSEG